MRCARGYVGTCAGVHLCLLISLSVHLRSPLQRSFDRERPRSTACVHQSLTNDSSLLMSLREPLHPYTTHPTADNVFDLTQNPTGMVPMSSVVWTMPQAFANVEGREIIQYTAPSGTGVRGMAANTLLTHMRALDPLNLMEDNGDTKQQAAVQRALRMKNGIATYTCYFFSNDPSSPLLRELKDLLLVEFIVETGYGTRTRFYGTRRATGDTPNHAAMAHIIANCPFFAESFHINTPIHAAR